MKMVGRMDPEEALAEITRAVKPLLVVLGEEIRQRFLLELIGETGDDKVASLVHR